MQAIGICLLAAAVAATTPARASPADDSEWFVALKASTGIARMANSSHGGTIGTGAQIGDDIDGRIDDPNPDDYVPALGVAAGRRFGLWTLEAEYVYRYRADWDLVIPTPTIQTITNVFSNVETETWVLSLIRRGVLNRHWSWEAGAGIGVAHKNFSTEYIERATPTAPQQLFKDSGSRTDFSYHGLLGVVRELRGPWSMNIRYRYIDLGDLETGPFPSRSATVDADFSAHEIQLSFERKL